MPANSFRCTPTGSKFCSRWWAARAECRRVHPDALRQPDFIVDAGLLERRSAASGEPHQNPAERNRVQRLEFRLDPAIVLLIDPQLAFDLGKVSGRGEFRFVSRLGGGCDHVDRKST